MPQLNYAELRIAAAYIPNELQFFLGMLVGMAVQTSGLADEGLQSSVPALIL